MGLVDLPEDVLLEIAWHLSVIDVLSLKQTCRVLHAFGSADYLWHQLAERIDLPLNIPSGIPITSLTSDELQRIAIQAKRLDTNWRKPTPVIKGIQRILKGTMIMQPTLQLAPGGKWLLTMERLYASVGRLHSRITLWNLKHLDDVKMVARLEYPGICRTSAVYVDEGRGSAIVYYGMHDDHEWIGIHTVSLADRSATDAFYGHSPVAVTQKISVQPRIPTSTTYVHGLTGTNQVIAAQLAVHAADHTLTWHVLLIKIGSGFSQPVHPAHFSDFHTFWVRLNDQHLFLIGQIGTKLVLRVHRLPDAFLRRTPKVCHIRSYSDFREEDFMTLDDPVMVFEEPLRSTDCYDDSSISTPSGPSISTIFGSMRRGYGYGQITHFPLDTISRDRDNVPSPSRSRVHSYHFSAQDASLSLPQIGATGRRAAWLEHNWEEQQKRIMRYERGEGSESISELISHYPDLPFVPNACSSLAFDEVSGRLCVSLMNGELYLLDFV